jgi:histidine ammonia-lyase
LPEGTKILPARQALEIAGLKPIQLAYKEGIALNNGTTFMTALGVLAIYDSKQMFEQALQSVAMVLEAIMARRQAFDLRIHQVRNHKGQMEVAQKLKEKLQDSTLFGLLLSPPNHQPSTNYQPKWLSNEVFEKLAEKKTNPQDAYSIRCSAQVLGASWHAIQHVEEVMLGELNAVTDNPLLFEETEEVLSGGNFHGQPLALSLDYLKIALAEIGNLLERQVNKLTDANHNDFLPPFLVEQAGLNSGFMIPQYVCASLVSENKVLAHPASVDSIPTSANQEDHVSMGSISARQALEILENVKHIVAIHTLVACQALDLRQKQLTYWQIPYQVSSQTRILHERVRAVVSYLDEDRLLYKDIEAVGKLLFG